MMEFTLSRLAMCACGLMIMAVVAGPVFGIFEGNVDSEYEDLATKLVEDIDAFSNGQADSMIMDMSVYLPTGTEMTIDGYVLALHADGREYTAIMNTHLDGSLRTGSSGMIVFQKTGAGITAASV